MANDLIPQDNNSESEVITLPEQEEKYSIIPTVVSNAFNKYYWDKSNAEDANIIDDPINMPQPERIGIDAPPPEVKLFQEKMEAKQKQKSPIIEKKKRGEVGKTLLKTLGKGASFVLPYLVKAAAAGIDNLAALPKQALEGSMSPEQKALYGGGLAGAFANVSAAAHLPVTDRMREISDALLLHRMQQKYIDMLKKQADYMKTLDLNGHQLDYLGRQASGIAFMNNKAPGAINGIKR